MWTPIEPPTLCALWLHCVQVGETAQTVLFLDTRDGGGQCG